MRFNASQAQCNCIFTYPPPPCPVRYLCIKYLVSRPKLILTWGSPPSRPHETANLPCKASCISRDMRVQQHKMSLPPLPTTTLAIIRNWVQRMGHSQTRRGGTPDCLVRGGKNRHGWGMVKKRCPAREYSPMVWGRGVGLGLRALGPKH